MTTAAGLLLAAAVLLPAATMLPPVARAATAAAPVSTSTASPAPPPVPPAAPPTAPPTAPPAAPAHAHDAGRLDVTVTAGRLAILLTLPLDAVVGFEAAPRNDRQRTAIRRAAERFRAPPPLFEPDEAAGCERVAVRMQSAAIPPALLGEAGDALPAKPETVASTDADGEARADAKPGSAAKPSSATKPTKSSGTTEKPATGKPATGKPTTGKPATGKPTTGKPATGKPSSKKPSTEKPPAEKPATEKPATAPSHVDLTVSLQFDCRAPQRLNSVRVNLFEAFPRLARIDANVETSGGQSGARLSPLRSRLHW